MGRLKKAKEIAELRKQVRRLQWSFYALGIGLILIFSFLEIKMDVIKLQLDGIFPSDSGTGF